MEIIKKFNGLIYNKQEYKFHDSTLLSLNTTNLCNYRCMFCEIHYFYDFAKKFAGKIFPNNIDSKFIKKFDDFIDALERNDNDGIDTFLEDVDEELNNVLTLRSDIGARANRVELAQRRINDNNITFVKLLSSAEDANMAEVVMFLKNSENVYKSSLSTGARIIQPTLIDFLR